MTIENGDSERRTEDELREELDKIIKSPYFRAEKANTRHEAWFLASALSNILLIDELKRTRRMLKKILDKGE